MRESSRNHTYECSYCGATEEYIENGGKCECGDKWIWARQDDSFTYYDLNNVDNILEDKRA